MHSKQKINLKYPYLMEALPFYYGQVNHHDLEKNNLDWANLDKLDLSIIRKKITSSFLLYACRYQKIDCKAR